MEWFKHLFTEANNSTWCPVRVSSGLAAAIYHVAAGIGCYLGDVKLDIGTLGTYLQHMVLLIGVGGATITAKTRIGGDSQ